MKIFQFILYIIFCITCSFTTHAQKAIVDGKPTMQDEYSKKNGNLRMNKADVNFKKMWSNQIKSDTIRFLNGGIKNMSLSIGRVPQHLKVFLKDSVLNVGGKTFIAVTYDASKRNDFGFVIDRIMLQTNDSINPRKIFFVKATIDEFFPEMTAEDSANAPRLLLQTLNFNFGEVEKNRTVSTEIWMYNKGNKNLIIHTAKTNSGTIKVEFSKQEIAKNDSALLRVNFDALEIGEDRKNITIFTNDPFKPKHDFTVFGKIVNPKKN